MKSYNFDQWVERRGTGCIKYDGAKDFGKREDVLSLWVADMDFETAPEIAEAVARRAGHKVYGYTRTDERYHEAVIRWMDEHYGWKPEREWCVYTPGVVFALAMAIRAFTGPGEGVMIQRPVYYPFTRMIEKNGRLLVNSPLLYRETENGGRYEMDYEDFERKLTEYPVKLFILCNPHNPVGRAWSAEELKRIGDICIRHGVLVISDEIHQDFVLYGRKHNVFAGLGPEYGEISITCTAPSKTFNLAGLQASNIFISNPELRQRFQEEIQATGYGELNIFGQTACLAAYEHGGEWLRQLKEYLEGNIDYLREYLRGELPKIRLVEPEGTYLAWLDFRQYGYTVEELEERIARANLWFDGGTMFGPEGSGFQRVNIATTRGNLGRALQALKQI